MAEREAGRRMEESSLADFLGERLGEALAFRQVDAMRDLLARGVSPSYKINGETPLLSRALFALTVHKSSALDRAKEAFEVLLEAGADPDGENGAMQTSLHSAVFYGELGAAEALLGKGGRVLAMDIHGNTPAHYLGAGAGDENDGVGMAILLGAAGADFELKNKEGQSAMDLARARGRDQAGEAMAAWAERSSLIKEAPARAEGGAARKKSGL